ncbi:MAG: purine-binding chemotaxis protein CheW [Acidobacteria bacterium]|nr:purine-binding chemotaxis protein CheW [Acidobacteriota bacterium]MBI3487130.1 purine-binding chemotaxis protein CheW [Acidobacteriota bacterium]
MAELIKLPGQKLANRSTSAAGRSQYLAFSSGGETFAIDIRSVREVIQYGGLTEVPLMPSFIRGVINLRGSVVPVIDLSLRLGRTGTEVARRTCVVILEVPAAEGMAVVGVVVDTVNEVLEIGPEDIDPAPAFGHDVRAEFISGVGKVTGRFVILLNVQHVLSVQEMAALAGGREAAES